MRLDLKLFGKRLVIAAAVLAGVGVVWAQEAGGLQITELAEAVLPSVMEAPVQFGLLEVTVAAGESARYAVPEGMVYQVSGSQVVVWGGGSVTLSPGGGAYLGVSSEATFSAGAEEDAVLLHFLLTPVGEAGMPAVSVILEPFALVHRWANPYDEAAIVVLANVSPEGEPAVVFMD